MILKGQTMKTQTNTSANTLNCNAPISHRSLIFSVIIAAILFSLFVGLADKIDTGINKTLITRHSYELHFI